MKCQAFSPRSTNEILQGFSAAIVRLEGELTATMTTTERSASVVERTAKTHEGVLLDYMSLSGVGLSFHYSSQVLIAACIPITPRPGQTSHLATLQAIHDHSNHSVRGIMAKATLVLGKLAWWRPVGRYSRAWGRITDMHARMCSHCSRAISVQRSTMVRSCHRRTTLEEHKADPPTGHEI